MSPPRRPIAFTLVSSDHGSLIVNRNDYHMVDDVQGFGVGWHILCDSSYEPEELSLLLALLDRRHRHFGDGVVAVDGGANIGVHTVEFAKHMHGWGRVLAFEAQELVFYALAGNIALNNCATARARLAALGEKPGEIRVPELDPFLPASFGSLALRDRADNPAIGQEVFYDPKAGNPVAVVTLDSLELERIDLVKLDIEGMELEALRGGRAMLERCRPILHVEANRHGARAELEKFAAFLGYRTYPIGINMLAIHEADPTLRQLSVADGRLSLG
jgi:FkbM family methyltransferase